MIFSIDLIWEESCSFGRLKCTKFPTISSWEVYLESTWTNLCTICIIAFHSTVFIQNHRCIVAFLTCSLTCNRVIKLTSQLSCIINTPPDKVREVITTPVTISTEVTPDMTTGSCVTSIPGPSLAAVVSHHTRDVTCTLEVPVCTLRPATECTVVRINQNKIIWSQSEDPVVSYITLSSMIFSIDLIWEKRCPLWSMKNTILKAIVVFTSPAFDFITTRANLSTVSIVTLHETILGEYHGSAIILFASGLTCNRVVQLIDKICSIVNAPPYEVWEVIATPTAVSTEVTPNMTSWIGIADIPSPCFLTVGIRSNQANLWLQLSSNSYSKILWSHYLITITIDILEIYCLIRIRTTSRHKVEHTTRCATCEFELRAIGLDIVDINTRGIGDIILNPVSISCWSSAGLIGILRELSTIKQAIAGIAVDIQCLAILNRITSCEHAQRYCEQ